MWVSPQVVDVQDAGPQIVDALAQTRKFAPLSFHITVMHVHYLDLLPFPLEPLQPPWLLCHVFSSWLFFWILFH